MKMFFKIDVFFVSDIKPHKYK